MSIKDTVRKNQFWIAAALIVLAFVPDPSDAIDFGTPFLELGVLLAQMWLVRE